MPPVAEKLPPIVFVEGLDIAAGKLCSLQYGIAGIGSDTGRHYKAVLCPPPLPSFPPHPPPSYLHPSLPIPSLLPPPPPLLPLLPLANRCTQSSKRRLTAARP